LNLPFVQRKCPYKGEHPARKKKCRERLKSLNETARPGRYPWFPFFVHFDFRLAFAFGAAAACVWERRGDPACPPSPLFRQARIGINVAVVVEPVALVPEKLQSSAQSAARGMWLRAW
jgi:hypothetical protein